MHDDTRSATSVEPDVRARSDALSERLQGLEDAIDVIARRLSHRSRRERRTDRRTAELVESIAESVEAHAIALDSLGTAIERIGAPLLGARGRGASRLRAFLKRAALVAAQRPTTAASTRHPGISRWQGNSLTRTIRVDFSGSSIRGSIGDMSLSTVLAMLEIERRSGRLKVQGDDGSLVAFELEDGSVVGSRVSENDMDAVESLREVLTWKNGRFWFRQKSERVIGVATACSVNSLLLEATRQIDEAVRAG